MNWDQIEGKWDQVKGQVKEKWGKFTPEDMAMLNGKKDQLQGRLRERYGFSAEQADKEMDTFMKSCNCGSDSATASKPQTPA